jgi:hypothetical protein
MIEAYNATLPYRIGFAVVFFLVLGFRDWRKNPERPTRVYEYLFLIVSMLLSIVYGIVHDHITATISADYFLKAKGLETDPRPFRIAVTWLAIKATYGPGVLAGAFMLFANNPSAQKPQLPYRQLLRLCVYPVVFGAACATLGGILTPLAVQHFEAIRWFRDAALAYTPPDRVTRFLAVWGVHAGSYFGAVLGTVVAVVCVSRGRKALASKALGSRMLANTTAADENATALGKEPVAIVNREHSGTK